MEAWRIEDARQLEVAGGAPELVSGRVTKLVHGEVRRSGLDEAALEPSMHGRRLHRALRVLPHDAAQVRVLPSVPDPGGEEEVVLGLRPLSRERRPRSRRSSP